MDFQHSTVYDEVKYGRLRRYLGLVKLMKMLTPTIMHPIQWKTATVYPSSS